MKNFKYTIQAGIIGIMLTLGSCEKEIFEEPYTSLSPKDAFSTPDRITKSATGMYDQLQNLEFFGGRVLIYADIRGIDAFANTFFGNMPQFNTTLSSDATVAAAWKGAYRTIYESNNFITNLAANPGKISPALSDQYIGEGKFIRSLCYFYLVNLWAQPYNFTPGATHPGVPLVLTIAASPFEASNQIKRNTVAEVYNQIETDLLDAEAKLPIAVTSGKSFTDVARATKGAAQALLMRLYLYKHDYQKAIDYANKIIASNVYSLNASPETAFRSPYTSDENIFSVGMSGGDNPNTNNAIGQHYAPDKRGDITISPDYVNLMDPADKRRTLLIRTYAPNPGTFYTTKYTGVVDWVPVLRYSEVLLTKAEALANLGPAGGPGDLVNQVHSRSSTVPLPVPANQQELIDQILLERRIELAFEGQGELDFLRTGRDIPAHSTTAVQPFGSNFVVLPIPKYDTDKNPNLVQNPGY
jgi:starch-binding outer membrane protein, SusD/RagB family